MKKNFCLLALITTLIALTLIGCKNQNNIASKINNSNIESKNPTFKEVKIENSLPSGTEIEVFSHPPKKAVSLSGFTTEMLLALGVEDSIAGYSYHDNEVLPQYKAAHSKLTELSDLMPSKETVVGVEADFITGWLATFNENNFNSSFCKDNNIKIYVPKCEDPNATMETVYEDFMNLGKIFNVENNAKQIVSDMKLEIEKVTSNIPNGLKPVKTFVYDSGTDSPFTVCNGLPTELIKLAGGENIFNFGEKPWSKVTWEEVVAKNPEQIIITKYNGFDNVEEKIDFLKNYEAIKDIDAIKNNNIFILGLADMSGGVRNPDCIKTMAKNFHPEVFKD